ncbi:hypothetical protein SCLARK_001531 [Spiroplasma clarkii]|nr:hypothetical protein [Spiroplasma clarkii]ARU92041.1 hypothetical protein SCLARK_001531 [Spiroplasma clarkii]
MKFGIETYPAPAEIIPSADDDYKYFDKLEVFVLKNSSILDIYFAVNERSALEGKLINKLEAREIYGSLYKYAVYRTTEGTDLNKYQKYWKLIKSNTSFKLFGVIKKYASKIEFQINFVEQIPKSLQGDLLDYFELNIVNKDFNALFVEVDVHFKKSFKLWQSDLTFDQVDWYLGYSKKNILWNETNFKAIYENNQSQDLLIKLFGVIKPSSNFQGNFEIDAWFHLDDTEHNQDIDFEPDDTNPINHDHIVDGRIPEWLIIAIATGMATGVAIKTNLGF